MLTGLGIVWAEVFPAGYTRQAIFLPQQPCSNGRVFLLFSFVCFANSYKKNRFYAKNSW